MRQETVHVRYVAPLIAAGDWTALARYHIAHQYEPALTAAVTATHVLVARDRRWAKLSDYLQNIGATAPDRSLTPPLEFLAFAGAEEQLTITLIALYHRAIWCELGRRLPLAEQEQAFRRGTEAAREAVQTLRALEDKPLEAFFLRILARGMQELRQLEDAAQFHAQSLVLYRRLAKARPAVYRPYVAMALKDFGAVQSDLNELEDACRSLTEGLNRYRELADTRKEVYRRDVAETLLSLGNAQRCLGELVAARKSLDEGLTIYRELAEGCPKLYLPDVATALTAFGLAQRFLGDFQDAYATLMEGLHLCRHLLAGSDLYRPEMAATLNSLGIVQLDLGDQESARKLFEEALSLRRILALVRPEAHEPDMAKSLINLGSVQVMLHDWEAASMNLGEALSIYRRLTEIRPTVYRGYVAMTLLNLGVLQHKLNDLETSSINLNESVGIYRQLAAARPKSYRPLLASALEASGYPLLDLNNLEAARACMEEALGIYRELDTKYPNIYRGKVSATLNGLGTAQKFLWELSAARVSLEEAVTIERGLMTSANYDLGNLATVLYTLSGVQHRLYDFDAAVTSIKGAIAIRRKLAGEHPQRYLRLLANAVHGLGSVQIDLGNLEDAYSSFKESLDIYHQLFQTRPEMYRSEMAMTYAALGLVHRALRDPAAAYASLYKAAQLYEADPMSAFGALLAHRGKVWAGLGEILRDAESGSLCDFIKSREALRHAVRYAEDLRGRLHDRSVRTTFHAWMFEPYPLLVRTCVDLWDTVQDSSALKEAVEVAEKGRARNLIERLSENDLVPRNAAAERVATFLRLRRDLESAKLAVQLEGLGLSRNDLGRIDEKEEAAITVDSADKCLRNLRRTLRDFGCGDFCDGPAEPKTEITADGAGLLAEAEARYAAMLAELRTADSEWEPDRPVRPLTAPEIQALVPTDVPTAFVQFTLTKDMGIALVVDRENIDCVKLPKLSEGAAGDAGLEWVRAYGEDRDAWEGQTDSLLARLGAALGPLWSSLKARNIERVVLSPNRWLHIFPLQACLLAGGKQRAADAFEIVYSPSFSVLGKCASRTRPRTGATLIVGNPTSDLDFSETEIASAQCHYPTTSALLHASATKAAIFDEAVKCRIFLYTGHATFDSRRPMHSALVLESKDETERAKWLSLADAFCRLNLGQCELAILNGCESGLLLPDTTDEYLALSSGFLHAGAVAVVSTLWAVDDLSAALLMDRFHTEWLSGKTIAAAVREAARWLRQDIRSGNDLIERVLPEFLRKISDTDLRDTCMARATEYANNSTGGPPFASPAHWAAFTAVGKAW